MIRLSQILKKEIDMPTREEFDILRDLLTILENFEKETRRVNTIVSSDFFFIHFAQVSEESSTCSIFIPSIQILLKSVKEFDLEFLLASQSIREVIQTLKTELETRLDKVKKNPLLRLSVVLDPRFNRSLTRGIE